MRLNSLIADAVSLLLVVGTLGFAFSPTANADGGDSMTQTAKVAQSIQSKLHAMVQVPLSYNYNQNRQPTENYTQAQFQLAPIVPFLIDADHAIVLNPMISDSINAQNQQTTSQVTPLQLATFYAPKGTDYVYGIGPFIQMPTANPNGGSQQTGLGVSYGGFYEPKHWVIGGLAYNAWGVGSNRSAGTANVYFFNPLISYTSDNAWSYILQSWINGNPTNGQSHNSNQLILSLGKTHKINKSHLQWQIGPSYMVTPTPTSPQGWGGFFSLTLAFDEYE